MALALLTEADQEFFDQQPVVKDDRRHRGPLLICQVGVLDACEASLVAVSQDAPEFAACRLDAAGDDQRGERIETERLLLRPIRIDDVDLLVELDSDPEVMRFLTGRPSARAEVETSIRANLGHRWIALDRASGEFVGWFGLVPLGDDAFELGYRLVRRWWGCGLATEGARAMIDEAFTMLGARRVAAQTMAVNQRSRRVMERCGMRNLRTFHVDFEDPLPGTEHGETEYELIIDEWHRRKP